MSNVQIPNLPAAISLNGSEQIEAVQGGTSTRITTQQIAQYTSNTYPPPGIASVTANSPLSSNTVGDAVTITLPSQAITNQYLALMPSGTVKANLTVGSAVPSDVTPSAILDTIGSTKGDIVFRSSTNWQPLHATTNYDIITSGGPSNDILYRSLDTIIDHFAGSTQGSIYYRDASGWVGLPPSTAGRVLSTNGAGANPSWVTAGTGTVTQINTGTGLTGGPVTTTGTISIANTAVSAGSYGSASSVPTYTVNAQGQLTAASNTAISIPSSAINTTIPNSGLTNSSLTVNGTSISLGGSGTITANTTATLTFGTGLSGSSFNGSTPVTAAIANTSVTADSYGSASSVATFTVNAQGQLTAASSTPINGIALTTGTISTAPTNATDIANKDYVDSVAAGLNFHQACNYATTTALPSYVYNNGSSGVGATITASVNGALTIDGYTFVVGDIGKRILVKNETAGNAPYNGIYTLTQPGNASAKFVLTRATDYDSSGTGTNEIDAGDFVLVLSGTTNANTSWVQQTPLPITVGTTAITFIQFGGSSTAYTAGTGLSLVGNIFSIANTGVTATSYGSASAVPVVTVNAQGQLTSVVPTNIAIAGSQITSGSVATTVGGTGLTAYTTGDLLYSSASNVLSSLPIGTTGQILTVSGGIPTWAAAPATGVTSITFGTTGLTPNTATTGAVTVAGTLNVANGGTGLTTLTAGYIPFGNGTSAFGSSANLFWDNANTRLGLGTSTPAYQLELTQSARIGAYLGVNANPTTSARINATQGADYTLGTNYAVFFGGSGYSGGIALDATSMQIGQNSASRSLTFHSGASFAERMRINGSTGNVNIGAAAAAAVKLAVTSTDAILIPVGTTAERPTGATGYLRFNTTTTAFEGYNGTAWGSIGGGATGGGTDQIFYLNGQTVTTNYSIPSGQNAGTFGPITINSGATVTVPSGSTWSII